MITGLLATPEYVRASLAQAPPEQQAKAVAMKLDRQRVLFDRSKLFTFILTEQAVRYPLVPPHELAMQIDRLVSFTRQPNIRLGIIPMGVNFSSGALNTFTVYLVVPCCSGSVRTGSLGSALPDVQGWLLDPGL